jgi:hypothetical protein
MNEAIAWALFAGSWLLVAGPLYQAGIELNELELDHEGIHTLANQLPRPQLPSAWWWLLPPVMYYLAHRRNQANQRAIFAAMTDAQRAQFRSFKNKAAGWLTVALGATLLAAGETWDIVEHYEWPQWLFWLLIVVMLGLSVINTAVRMASGDRDLRRNAAAATPEPG